MTGPRRQFRALAVYQHTGLIEQPEEKRNTVAFPFYRARRFTETFVLMTALRLTLLVAPALCC